MLETIDESELIKTGRKVIKVDHGYVNHTCTKCNICKKNETGMLSNGRPHWLRHVINEDGNFDPNGNWDRKSYICVKCYDKECRKLPDSHTGLIKSMRKFRNKELPKDCSSGKGFIGEQIWCKARGVENCNIKKDNFAWYEKYRVYEKPYNDAYHNMNIEDCPILKDD